MSDTKSYKLSPPLKIEIEGSHIVITDGVISLKYPPPVKIPSASSHFIEFALSSKEHQTEKVIAPEKIGDFVHVFTRKAKFPSAGIKGVYEYYKDEKNQAYLVLVLRGYRRKKFMLGSLKDHSDLLRKTLEILPKRFSKKDLYRMDTLPKEVKHGQLLKATLDVLVEEKLIKLIPTANGLKEVYERTGKVIEESEKTKLE